MADPLGIGLELPKINISGFLSSTWLYVAIVALIGFIFVVLVAFLLFRKTYSRRIIIFENISGLGYQPVLKTKARIVKLGIGGDEVFKTFAGGMFLTAYGRKMGKNTYWFAKARDGYYYNIVLGDIDTKLNMLDIEPVDRDVRMFHVALDRLSHATYGKQGFLEKYGTHILLFVFLLVFILGMWFIIGKIGNSTSALSATAETNREVAEVLRDVLRGADNIRRTTDSGIVPAT